MNEVSGGASTFHQVAVGEGMMPVKKIFEVLGAIRYKGFVDLEYEIHADDPMRGVIESFAYMRGSWRGWGRRAGLRHLMEDSAGGKHLPICALIKS